MVKFASIPLSFTCIKIKVYVSARQAIRSTRRRRNVFSTDTCIDEIIHTIPQQLLRYTSNRLLKLNETKNLRYF